MTPLLIFFFRRFGTAPVVVEPITTITLRSSGYDGIDTVGPLRKMRLETSWDMQFTMEAFRGGLYANIGSEQTEEIEMRPIQFYDPTIVGDGSDETVKIRAALLEAVAYGGVVWFPPGIYGISDTILTLGPGERLEIRGSGINSTIFRALSAIADPVVELYGEVLTSPPFNHQAWFFMSDCSLRGNNEDILWFRPYFGFHMYLSHLHFSGNDGTVISGLAWGDSHIYSCHFTAGGTVGVPVVELEGYPFGYPEQNVNNIKLSHCRFEGLDGDGVYCGSGSHLIWLDTCKFDTVAGKCIDIDDAYDMSIRHCQFAGDSAAETGIAGDLGNGVLIEGCKFNGMNNGINVTNFTNSWIVNNAFGMRLANGTNYTMAGGTNIIDNNQIG